MIVVKNLDRVNLKIRLVPYRDSYCNAKLVFENLEEILGSAGLKIVRAETRESGRGSCPALRIRTSSPKKVLLELPVRLDLKTHDDGQYGHKLILHNLESGLRENGVVIGLCSTRAAGRNSELALRLTLD